MKILIIPDKFKDSLSSVEVCDAIETGINEGLSNAQIVKIPIADGGEGSLEVLEKVIQFERIYVQIKNPLLKNITTYYGMLNNIAFIEMASASGLQLLKFYERNPMLTTSFGTGEIILDAINKAAKKIYLFIGGSATNDAAIGIASALGYKFLDEHNNILAPIGKSLIKIKAIDSSLAISLEGIEFNVLTDVKNILWGKEGAAFIFAGQKGANNNEIEILDSGLQNISKIIYNTFGIDVSQIQGGGAAGGVGSGMVAFCNSKILNGINEVMELLNIDYYIQQSDFIITGEGLLDKQTLNGKLIKGVAERCKKMNKPFGIICGDIKLSENELQVINPSITKTLKVSGISKEEAIKNAYQLLVIRAQELIKEWNNKIC